MASEDKVDSMFDLGSITGEANNVLKEIERVALESIKLMKSARASGATASTPQDLATSAAASKKAEVDLSNAVKLTTDIINQQNKSVANLSTSYKELTQQSAKNEIANKALTASKKALADEYKKGNISQDDYIAKLADLKEAQTQISVSNQDLNRALKNMEKEFQSAGGSLDEMRARLNQATQAYDRLSEEDRNSEFGKELLTNITNSTEKLKTLEGETGRFQRNVGDYANKLSGSFGVLKDRLDQIKKQLQDNAKISATPATSIKNTTVSNVTNNNVSNILANAEATKKLEKEQRLLEAVIGKNADGFNNLGQAIKAQTTALQLMIDQGLKGTDTYNKLFDATAVLKDEFQDLKDELKFSSDSQSGVDKFANSLKQLAAIYQVVEGSAALFGVENEELQRSTQRLVAVQNIANGIYQLQEEIKRKGSIVNTLYNLVMYGQTTATTQATVATGENIIATEGQAAATAVATTATTGLTIATRVLRAALIATGIGALIVLVGLLVEGISNWSNSDKIAIENQKALSAALNEEIGTLKELVEIRRFANDQQIAALERENELTKTKGVNAATALALDLNLARQKADIAKKEFENYGITEKEVLRINGIQKKATDDLISKQTEKENYLKKVEASGDKADEKKMKQFDLEIGALQQNATTYKSAFDLKNGILQNFLNTNQNVLSIQKQAEKLNADEQREYTLASAQLTSQGIIDANERILSNELSTQQQRLNAIKSNAAEARKIAIAENQAIQSDPTISEDKKKIAEKKLNADLIKINADSKIKLSDENRDWRNRELKAESNYQKLQIDTRNKFLNEVASNDNISLDKRLKASADFQQANIDLENASYLYELNLLKQKAAAKGELELFEANHNAKLVELNANGQTQILDILISSKEKNKQILDERYSDVVNSYQDQQNKIAQNLNKEVQAINQSYQDKIIGRKEYLKQIEKAEYNSSIATINNQIESAKKQISLFGNTELALARSIKNRETAERDLANATTEAQTRAAQKKLDLAKKDVEVATDADNKKKKSAQDLSNAEVALSKATTDKVNTDREKQREKLLQALDYAKQLIDGLGSALQTIIGANFERQKQGVQEQIDTLDKQKEAAIAAANAEAISTSEKADKIAIINANAQAKKEALERKQREIDNRKAKADRAFQIFNIIGNTAIAVTKALIESPLNPVPAILAGILGAAQLAAILAVPIPKYAKGGVHTKDGPALVGDGGKQEVGVNADGSTFITPNRPTLMNLSKGTKIYPSIEAYQDTLNNAAMYATLQSGGTSINNSSFETAYLRAVENKLSETNAELRGVKNAIANMPGMTINNSWAGTQTKISRGASIENWINDIVKT